MTEARIISICRTAFKGLLFALYDFVDRIDEGCQCDLYGSGAITALTPMSRGTIMVGIDCPETTDDGEYLAVVHIRVRAAGPKLLEADQ